MKHGIHDDNMIPAFNHPVFVDDPDDVFTVFVGADDNADELAARFEHAEPDDLVDATAPRVVRRAFLARAETERTLRGAVVRARHDGHSWSSIGAMVGTSGEAARQRYGRAVNAEYPQNRRHRCATRPRSASACRPVRE